MNITILSVQITTTPTKTGSYQMADVAYKNNSFQGKVEGKKVMSFGATANSFKTLATAQPNETYDVEVVKNDKGYNDWVSMQKAGDIPQPATVQGVQNVSNVQRGSTAAPRSTYETPEERAIKQVYIVRQSSLGVASGLLSVGAKTPPAADTVIDLAKKFEAFVFGKTDPGPSGFADFPDVPDEFEQQPKVI